MPLSYDNVMLCNEGYIDIAKNCLHHLRENDLAHDTYVYCTDATSYRAFAGECKVIPVMFTQYGKFSTDYQPFNSPWFIAMMAAKLNAIIQHMATFGRDVLYMDADTVLFNAPDVFNYADHDIVLSRENEGKSYVCAGFMFCRNTKAAVAVLEKSLEMVGPGVNDQTAMCRLLLANDGMACDDVTQFRGARIGLFSEHHYISGYMMTKWNADRNQRAAHANRIVMFHANGVGEKHAKINLLRWIGKWQ